MIYLVQEVSFVKLAIKMWDHKFVSDLENEDSLRFHKAMGFQEANRIICFKKDI